MMQFVATLHWIWILTCYFPRKLIFWEPTIKLVIFQMYYFKHVQLSQHSVWNATGLNIFNGSLPSSLESTDLCVVSGNALPQKGCGYPWPCWPWPNNFHPIIYKKGSKYTLLPTNILSKLQASIFYNILFRMCHIQAGCMCKLFSGETFPKSPPPPHWLCTSVGSLFLLIWTPFSEILDLLLFIVIGACLILYWVWQVWQLTAQWTVICVISYYYLHNVPN